MRDCQTGRVLWQTMSKLLIWQTEAGKLHCRTKHHLSWPIFNIHTPASHPPLQIRI